jgi:hypothetical protein
MRFLSAAPERFVSRWSFRHQDFPSKIVASISSNTSLTEDRLVRDKTLDLNYFLQKHVRSPALVRITRRVVLGRKSKQILEVVEKETGRSRSAPLSTKIFLSLFGSARKIVARDREISLPGAAEAADAELGLNWSGSLNGQTGKRSSRRRPSGNSKKAVKLDSSLATDCVKTQ